MSPPQALLAEQLREVEATWRAQLEAQQAALRVEEGEKERLASQAAASQEQVRQGNLLRFDCTTPMMHLYRFMFDRGGRGGAAGLPGGGLAGAGKQAWGRFCIHHAPTGRKVGC